MSAHRRRLLGDKVVDAARSVIDQVARDNSTEQEISALGELAKLRFIDHFHFCLIQVWLPQARESLGFSD